MAIRVPLLLQRSVAVVYRLDVVATAAVDPPGGDEAVGYDPDFREPVVYSAAVGGARTSTRRELAAIRIGCQVEVASFERLREMGLGDAPITNKILVFHRAVLKRLSLLNADGSCKIRRNDRIGSIERWGGPVGTTVLPLAAPGLFVYEVRPASWGFGPDGYDLNLCLTSERPQGVEAR